MACGALGEGYIKFRWALRMRKADERMIGRLDQSVHFENTIPNLFPPPFPLSFITWKFPRKSINEVRCVTWRHMRCRSIIGNHDFTVTTNWWLTIAANIVVLWFHFSFFFHTYVEKEFSFFFLNVHFKLRAAIWLPNEFLNVDTSLAPLWSSISYLL